jgi:hypothetical protein
VKAQAIGRIAREFRRGFLGKQSSTDMCFVLSTALDSYLGFLGVDCELVEGKVGKNHHYWLYLCESGHILDATADQFQRPDGSPMPEVYIGTQPDWYVVPRAYARLDNRRRAVCGRL